MSPSTCVVYGASFGFHQARVGACAASLPQLSAVSARITPVASASQQQHLVCQPILRALTLILVGAQHRCTSLHLRPLSTPVATVQTDARLSRTTAPLYDRAPQTYQFTSRNRRRTKTRIFGAPGQLGRPRITQLRSQYERPGPV